MSVTEEKLKIAIEELYNRNHTVCADWFTAKVFDLIEKADMANRARLSIAFPAEVLAWERWQHSSDEKEFFKTYGIGV